MFSIFTREGFIQFLYFLPALLLSLSIHEFGHAIVAYKLGDKSQKSLGRLSLSPFSHIDPIGFISIALFGVGWGKPVLVDDRYFKNRSRDNMLVALAGPMFNLGLAVVLTIILKILSATGIYTFGVFRGEVFNIIDYILAYTIQFNVVFAVFNLFILPPFDGSKVLYYFLPYKLKGWMDFLEKYSIWIVLLMFFTPIPSLIVSPAYKLVEILLNVIMR